MSDDSPIHSFIWSSNGSNVRPNSQLYTDARLSPLSLTYYAFCLLNGNYTINLHFTKKIRRVFLGKRALDVYIQVHTYIQSQNYLENFMVLSNMILMVLEKQKS